MPPIDPVASSEPLQRSQAQQLMAALLSGHLADDEIEHLLTTLHHRPPTPQELAGFLASIQQASTPLPLTPAERDALVDTCGTGGDGSSTFNISTAVALVAAAAGVPVAKHGNRRVSSQCGSADILERLGVPIEHTPQQAADALRTHNFAFLLAPSMHPAMRHAAPVRRRLPFRTVFNLLGPMSNPAGARRQVLGVYSQQAVSQVAEALAFRGTMLHALVVHGTSPTGDGLDEVSLSGDTVAAEVKGTGIRHLVLRPEDAGLARSGERIPGGNPEANEIILREIFAGASGVARDIVLLNAAAVFLVADRVANLAQGALLAARTIDSGDVQALLHRLSDGRRSTPETTR